MTNLARLAAATAAIGGLAVPAAAQTPYPYTQPYQQPYSGYGQAYPGYQQPYGYQNNGNVIGQVIDQLLGNRYNVTDRQAIRQCASAAVAQAAAQFRTNGYGYNGYGGQGYAGGNRYDSARVTAITDVRRRSSGLRVSGMLDSRGGYGTYAAPGYGNRGFAAGGGDLTFRCNVDYRGAVTNVRVRPNTNRY